MAEGWGMAGWGGVLEAGGGGGGGGGGPAPVVSNFSPAPGTSLGRSQAIEFDVTFSAPLVAIIVSVRYEETGATEVVYNREGFSNNFAPLAGVDTNGDGIVDTAGFLGSERQSIPGGYHFILRRRAGWPGSPKVLVEGADNTGSAVSE